MGSLDALGPALLHTLWQGPLIAALMFAVLRAVPPPRANTRYAVAVLALAALTISFIATWARPTHEPFSSTPLASPGSLPSPAPVSAESLSTPPTAPPKPPLAALSDRVKTSGASAINTLKARPLLLRIWSLGAVFMLARAIWMLYGARSLARASIAASDPAVLALFEELRRATRAPLRSALRFSATVAGPVALGFFRPMVLLPAAYATGITPELLRAALAHELAHLRRYDYVINLLQLLAEAFLYFNPALWLISRQIRTEREACCDAIAATVAGGPANYVVALAELARHAVPPLPSSAVMAAGGHERSLLDRVRRLILPDYRPSFRLRWYSLAAIITLGFLGLAATYNTTRAAEQALVRYLHLNDAERVELLKANESESGFRRSGPQVAVSGELRNADGSLFTADAHVNVVWQDPSHHELGATAQVSESKFRLSASAGEFYVVALPWNHLPAYAGPFVSDGIHEITGANITFQEGAPLRIRLVNASGETIPNAKVTASRNLLYAGYGERGKPEQEASGCFVLRQTAPPLGLSLRISADGYTSKSFSLEKEAAVGEITIPLANESPVEVIVVHAETGAPVEDVRFIGRQGIFREVANDEAYPAVQRSPGHYFLPGINPASAATFLARSKSVGGAVFFIEVDPDSPITVKLEPMYFHGHIECTPEQLTKLEEWYRLPTFMGLLPLYRSDSSATDMYNYEEIKLTIDQGIPRFRLDGVIPGQIMLLGNNGAPRMELREPVEDYVIRLEPDWAPWKDLEESTQQADEAAPREDAQPATLLPEPPALETPETSASNADRQPGDVREEKQAEVDPASEVMQLMDVANSQNRSPAPNGARAQTPASSESSGPLRSLIIECEVPEGAPAVNGSLLVMLGAESKIDDGNGGVEYRGGNKVTITNGRGECQIPIGKKILLSFEELRGYSIADDAQTTFVVQAANTPYVAHLQLNRNSVISGTVKFDDGRPAPQVMVSIDSADHSIRTTVSDFLVTTDESGAFAFSEVPLDVPFRVRLHYRDTEKEQTVRLDKNNVTAQLDFSLPTPPQTRSVRVFVVRPDGTPVHDFNISVPEAKGQLQYSHGNGMDDATVLEGLDVGTPYTVWIVPAKKFKPVAVTIDGFSTELTATLREPGRVCEGRILLEGSNAPIPNARVRITLPNHCSAPEVYTDEEGRFRLTNLPDAQVTISLWPAPEGYRCDVIGEIPLAPDGSTVVYFKKAESR